MVAPRALVFRPLVKGNEALGTRLHGRQNRNQRAFEVTEVDNFPVFYGAFHAKRLDNPVQLARNTGRTGVLGWNPA